MGKGSSPRPYSVPKAEYDNRFDEIFRKNKDKVEPPQEREEKQPLDHEKTKDTK